MRPLPVDILDRMPPDYDLGEGVTCRWWLKGARLFVTHPRPDGTGSCTGTVVFGDDDHTLVTADPLTISPSLACPTCGWHRFITGGHLV